jgi:hypothetical protein
MSPPFGTEAPDSPEVLESPIPDLCPRCGCCSLEYVECQTCGGEGVSGHDCGEDCCPCLYPVDNVPCDICLGKGGWTVCLGRCDKDGKHERDRTL